MVDGTEASSITSCVGREPVEVVEDAIEDDCDDAPEDDVDEVDDFWLIST
jgi:hypothetical protein